MKTISLPLLVFIILLVSCNAKKTNSFYYDKFNPNIYFFNNSNLEVFNLLDSTFISVNYKVNKNIFNINNEEYQYKKQKDSLVIYDYPEIGKNTILIEFELKTFHFEDVASKHWKMEVEKVNRENNIKYIEEQFLRFDSERGIDAYYRQENDTIYGINYNFAGNYFNKFILFKKEFKSVLVYSFKSNEINILIYDGFNKTSSYKLEEFTPIKKTLNNVDELPLLNENKE